MLLNITSWPWSLFFLNNINNKNNAYFLMIYLLFSNDNISDDSINITLLNLNV